MGEPGAKGPTGEPGVNGKDGKNGQPGTPGKRSAFAQMICLIVAFIYNGSSRNENTSNIIRVSEGVSH